MFFKRLIDFFVAGTTLALLVWFLPVVAFFIKRDSVGPVFLRQQRVGKDGQIFKCMKLRTMYLGTENLGTHEISVQAVTGVGRILRRLKFDELPQIWNVLMGDMSLVGPRPSLPGQTEVIAAREKNGTALLLPGISGLAQINYVDMSTPRKLAAYDALYLRNASVCMDIYIIGVTIMLSLRRVRKG